MSGQVVLAAADPGPEAQRSPQVLGLSVHLVNAPDQPGAQQLRIQKPLEEEGAGLRGKEGDVAAERLRPRARSEQPAGMRLAGPPGVTDLAKVPGSPAPPPGSLPPFLLNPKL